MNKEYFKRLTNEKSNILGKTFERSTLLGLDSRKFVKILMTEPKLLDMLYNDERTEWCDECFLLSVFCEIYPFEKGETLDKFTMWYLGYLYKYWMRTRKANPNYIYKLLPIDKFLNCFDFYHTQDWDYVIEDVLRSYK